MEESISRFLEKQTFATLCCTDEVNAPYCFTCYYSIHVKKGLLYFKSSPDSLHFRLLKSNPRVAGTVLPDKVSRIRTMGIQLKGEVLDPQDPLAKDATLIYHQQNPLALAIKGEVFCIRLDELKLTGSKLGGWKKTTWKRDGT